MKVKEFTYLLFLVLLIGCSGRFVIGSGSNKNTDLTSNSKVIQKERPITIDSISSMFLDIPIYTHPDSIIEWCKKDSNLVVGKWDYSKRPIARYVYKYINKPTNISVTDSINFLVDYTNWVDLEGDEIVEDWKGYTIIMVFHYTDRQNAQELYSRFVSKTVKLAKGNGIAINSCQGGYGISEYHKWEIVTPDFLDSNLHPDYEYFKIELLNSYNTPWQVKITLALSE